MVTKIELPTKYVVPSNSKDIGFNSTLFGILLMQLNDRIKENHTSKTQAELYLSLINLMPLLHALAYITQYSAPMHNQKIFESIDDIVPKILKSQELKNQYGQRFETYISFALGTKFLNSIGESRTIEIQNGHVVIKPPFDPNEDFEIKNLSLKFTNFSEKFVNIKLPN